MAVTTVKKTAPAARPEKEKPAKAAAKPSIGAPSALMAATEEGGKTPTVHLKKKELVTRVVAAMDGKKKGSVKEVVEATLSTLGLAIQNGESLNLPPFGKVRVTRQKGSGAEALATLRIRGAGKKNEPKTAKQPLAEPGEDD